MIHFLLPAYNEAENIERQIERLLQLTQQLEVEATVNVVNDGSTDATPQIVGRMSASDKRIRLINHERNAGPGKAFETGFKALLERAADTDAIISMDADNTHSEQTVRMMQARLHEGYELVIASVFAPGGMLIGVPFLRYILTLGCNFLYRVLFPVAGIKEYTGFYRAYRAGALRKALAKFEASGEPLITAFGFGCAAEILIKLRRIPLFMTEVPMLVRYDLKGGKSKLRIGRTIREHLRLLWHNCWHRNIL